MSDESDFCPVREIVAAIKQESYASVKCLGEKCKWWVEEWEPLYMSSDGYVQLGNMCAVLSVAHSLQSIAKTLALLEDTQSRIV